MPLNAITNAITDKIGRLFTTNSSEYTVHVYTGDRRGAGTDANVYLIIYDDDGVSTSVIRPNNVFRNDNERNSVTSVKISATENIHHPFRSVEIWRDNFGNIPNFLGNFSNFLFGGRLREGSAAWFLDRVEVEHACSGSKWIFPVQRWINADKHYRFNLYDCSLPSDECRKEERKKELEEKRKEYYYGKKVPNGPVQIAELPSDEKFSEEYFTCFVSERLKLLMQMKFINLTSPTWNSFTDLRRVYKHSLGEPECFKVWNEDWWFGLQRVQGVDPMLIQLCKQIPDKLGVDEETVKGLIDDFTLEEAINNNKIFICDIDITDGLVCPENREVASPIALFYLNKEDKLMPIAIQLRQKKADDNPVFTPKDAPNTWLVAKIFYNNAEAQHHQSLTHLGYTHFLMEGVCVCTHRNLSPSHPMFKLMAPHFLFLLAINTRGLEKLVNPGGWVDCCMTQGVEGMFALMIRGFDRWSFNIHSSPERNLRNRGVLDPNILPYYPYRDDAIPLHNAIKNYVTKVVNHYYDTEDKIREDHELKMWRDELVKDRNNNGVGLKDLPGSDNNGFETVDEIIEVVTFIISTCSLGHAASNFQQYEQYAFVPNYAGLLMDNPPRKKKEYTDSDLVSLIPNKEKTLEIMVITKLLSLRATQSLGDFEMQYMYHPKDVQAAEEFRSELNSLHLDILEKEEKRKDIWKFPHLDPVYIPNSISV